MDIQSEGETPVHSCTMDLNNQAIAAGWPVLCDPFCRFSDKKLAAAEQLWRQKQGETGRIPFRKDMTVRILQPYIPQLSIFEHTPTATPQGRYRVRLMGTNMVTYTKEMTGRFLDEVIDAVFLPTWYAIGKTILDFGGPVRLLFRGDTFGKKYLVGESFAAPLLTNDGRTELIMAVTSFDGAPLWETVRKQTRSQLGL